MEKKILDDSKNYTCQVVRIKDVTKHPNADRLQITVVQGNSVICGLNTKPGELYLYFPLESQLGEDYAKKNDMIRRKDADGKPAGGMFEENRRVRCLKLRGSKSEGCLMPLDTVEKLGIEPAKLKEGDEFNTLDEHLICKKYIIRNNSNGTKIVQQPKKYESKLIEGQFRLHEDTEQFKKHMDNFDDSDVISITQKMHGTSIVMGNILCKKKLPIWQKILRKIRLPIIDTHYELIYSSRKVIKNPDLNKSNHYYNEDIWSICSEKHGYKIPKGISLYGEIVGQLPSGQWIQNGYRYGTADKEWELYIYRATITNEDGKVTELSWKGVKNLCDSIGVKHVPEYFYGNIAYLNTSGKDMLTCLQDKYSDKTLPEGVPDEGVCIRNESKDFKAYKLKSFNFLEAETKSLDKGEVSIEETA